MTPRFAQHVDKIFMRAFDLLESINAGNQPSPEEHQRVINDEIRNAESALSVTGENWKLAKYALVSWIDELLLNAAYWSGREWWENHLLEWYHFQTAECHERFYIQAKTAASLPGADDALETFYVCTMLGFRGVYRPEDRDTESFALAVRQYGLPSDLQSWADGMANVIAQRRADRSAAADYVGERTIVTAKPLWGPARLFWPWLLALLLIGLCVVCFYQL